MSILLHHMHIYLLYFYASSVLLFSLHIHFLVRNLLMRHEGDFVKRGFTEDASQLAF